MRFLHPHGESAFLYAQPRKRRGASQPSEMAYCGHASERRSLKRSLEIAKPDRKSLGGSVVARIIGRNMPPLTHTMRHFLRQAQFFFGEADFFSAKRLFLRAARDVSGERSAPPWARVEIKLKMSFQALSHSPSHERASALTSPPPDFLFISIPQCPHPHIPTSPHPHIPTKSLIHPPG